MTAQAHEKLILDGEPATLACCPALPLDHPRLIRQPDRQIHSTGCWRGYVGAWEIRQDFLYLLGVEGLYALNGNEPLPADWVSETLRIPCGKVLHYRHMGFESVHEEDWFITVERGRVVARQKIDNRGRPPEDGVPAPPVCPES